jgi:hypothetical protein
MTDDETTTFEVRDSRGGNFLWLDHELLKVYAPLIGPVALAVYAALAMHSSAERDDGQTVYPSYQTIADEAGIDRRSAMRAVRTLAAVGLVHVPPRDPAGPRDANRITLLHVEKLHCQRNDEAGRAEREEYRRRIVEERGLTLNARGMVTLAALVTHSHQASDTQSPALVTHSHQASDSQSPEQQPVNNNPQKNTSNNNGAEARATPRVAPPPPPAASTSATPTPAFAAAAAAESDAVLSIVRKLAGHGVAGNGRTLDLARRIAGKRDVEGIIDAHAASLKRNPKIQNFPGALLAALTAHDFDSAAPTPATPPAPPRRPGQLRQVPDATPAEREEARHRAAERVQERGRPGRIAALIQETQAKLMDSKMGAERRAYYTQYLEHLQEQAGGAA